MESPATFDFESSDDVDTEQQQQENVHENHHRGNDASMSLASSKEEWGKEEEEEVGGGNYSENEFKDDGSDNNDGEFADAVQSAVTPSPNTDRDVVSPPTAKASDDDNNTQSSAENLADRAARRAAWPMTGIAEPGPNDCLFGRGGGTNHHPGNKLYRKIVEDAKDRYLASKRLDKPLVAMDIINGWRALDPPGRFLKLNDSTKLWDDVGDKKAREKTSQALREKTPVKQREGEERGDRYARFEPGLASPVSRHIKRSTLAREHSLGGEEIVSANELSLEGFSWDDSNEQQGVDAVVVVGQQHGRDHRYPPQYSGGHRDHYGGEYPTQPHYSYSKQHSLSNNPLSDATVSQPAPPVFGDPSQYYGHHYPPPPGPGYGLPPPGRQNASYPPPPPPPHPSLQNHQYNYSQHLPPTQHQLRSQEHGPQRNSHPVEGGYPSYGYPPPLSPSACDDGGFPPPPPPPHYHGYSPHHGWPTPPNKPTQPSAQFSYHSVGSTPSAFGRYDSSERSNYDNNAVSMGQYGRGTRPAATKAILREDPASAGSSQDYSKLAELIRDSSDSTTATPIDRSTSLVETGTVTGDENNIRRTMSMPQNDSSRGIVAPETAKQEFEMKPPAENNGYKSSLIHKLSGAGMSRNNTVAPLDGILRNSNPDYCRPNPVKRDTSNRPVEPSMKRVVLSRDQSEVARRLKEEQRCGLNDEGARMSSKLSKAEMLDRQMSVEMNMLGLEDRVTTEGFLSSFLDSSSDLGASSPIFETSPSMDSSHPKPMVRKDRVTTIDEIALDIANGKPPEEWDDTLDLVGLTENEIAEKWLKGET